MNLLCHFHLAVRDLGLDAAGIGAMLPDLWRMTDRRLRARWGVTQTGDASATLHALEAGVRHHLAADRWFHRHPAFTAGVAVAARALDRERIAGPKVRLFAHPLFELALDGALLRREDPERVLTRLRRARRSVAIDDLIACTGSIAPPEIDAEAAVGRLADLLDRIAAGPWARGYAHGDGLARRLDALRRRVGLPALDRSGRQRLAQSCDRVLADAEDRLPLVLASPTSPQAER